MSPKQQNPFLYYVGVVIGWAFVIPFIVLALVIAIGILLCLVAIITAPIWILFIVFNLMGVA